MKANGKGKSNSGPPAWVVVAVALADDLAVLVLVLLALWFFRVRISLPMVILLVVVLGTFVFIVHRAIIPSLRRSRASGREAMIGEMGEVVTKLAPEGTVRIAGEYWKATCLAGRIDAGKTVEVILVSGLVLTVKPAEK
ncbi:MAG: NfeD family protein [Chloroflexota bacterium]